MNNYRKAISLETKSFWFLYTIILVSPFLGEGLSWTLREPIYLIYLLFFLVTNLTRRFSFASSGVFLFSFYAAMSFCYSLLTGNALVNLAASRFVFLYPILFLVGVNCKDKLKDKDVLALPFLFGLISCCFGIIEFLYPESLVKFYVSLGGNDILSSRSRSGIGIGLTSILMSRVVFGFVIVYTMVICRAFFKRRSHVLAFEMFLLPIVFLTLSRTAIITAVFFVTIDFVRTIPKKRTISGWIFLLVILASLGIIVSNSDFFASSLNAFLRSIKAVDYSLSGRTDQWYRVISSKLSIAPNFGAFGALDYLEIYLGGVDSSFLRIFVNYGLSSIFLLVLLAFDIGKRWKHFSEYIKYSLIMLIMYSVTVDIFHILQVMAPLWVTLGLNFNYNSPVYDVSEICADKSCVNSP